MKLREVLNDETIFLQTLFTLAAGQQCHMASGPDEHVRQLAADDTGDVNLNFHGSTLLFLWNRPFFS